MATTANIGLAKVAVPFSADTFVVKIAIFAKPETVSFSPMHLCRKKPCMPDYILRIGFSNFEGSLRKMAWSKGGICA
ncbi:MAG: hypothetical protein ACOVSW_11055 [Candidatus Kapaibacteriota bacterium]